MSLLIGVVAHTKRKRRAHRLVNKVEAQVLNMDDTVSDSQDERFAACSANHFKVLTQLAALVTDQQWAIVLEDDAMPIVGFRTHAAAALECAPSALTGFYMNRAGAALNIAELQGALDEKKAWAASNFLISALAYAIRTDILPSVIERFPGFSPETTVEARVSSWAVERRVSSYSEPRFYYTLPSLVDHAPGESLIYTGISGDIRRAWNVGVADDWDTPAVEYDPS